MFNSGMEQRAESYFSSLSSMAQRIMEDKASVQCAHGATWSGLPYEQKCQKINDAIVKKKVSDKYAYYPVSKPDVDSFPKLCLRSGEKYVVDEENQQGKGSGNTWRDEHSGPFTWETQSQLDLTFASTESQKRAPPLPSKPPPQDKLGGSKFYKVLPTIATTTTTSSSNLIRPTTPTPQSPQPSTKQLSNGHVISEPTPQQQLPPPVSTNGNNNNNSGNSVVVPAREMATVGKVAAAVAAANSINNINSGQGRGSPVVGAPVVPVATVGQIRLVSPRDETDSGKPRTATVGRKPGATSSTPKAKPPPPPIPVAAQPQPKTVAVVREAPTNPVQLPPPPPTNAPEVTARHHHHQRQGRGAANQRGSTRTLPAQRSVPERGSVREARDNGMASSNDRLDLSPSSDSDIPKTGFDFLDNW